jgi:hypothetical protein
LRLPIKRDVTFCACCSLIGMSQIHIDIHIESIYNRMPWIVLSVRINRVFMEQIWYNVCLRTFTSCRETASVAQREQQMARQG